VLRRSRGALYAGLAVDNLGQGLFLPLSVVYVTRVVGLPVAVAGSVLSLAALVGLLSPAVAGRMVDRIGPRSVVAAAQLVQALGTATYLVADGVVSVAAAAMLVAAGTQMFYSALFLLVADVSEDGPKDRPFAVVQMVRGGAFGTGALLAGLLLATVSTTGLRLVVAVNTVTLLTAAVVLAVLVHPRRHGPRSRAVEQQAGQAVPVWCNRPFLGLILLAGLLSLTGNVFLVGAPVYLLDMLAAPAWLPGAALALLTTLTSTCGVLAVHLTRSLPRTTAMAVATGLEMLWCLMMVAAWWVSGPALVAWTGLATVVLSVAFLVSGSRTNALAEAAAPEGRKGSYLAAFQYAHTVSGILAPLVVSLFALGAAVPFLLLVAVTLVAVLLLPVLARSLPVHAVAGTASVSERHEPSGRS
jgi:MFS family permease